MSRQRQHIEGPTYTSDEIYSYDESDPPLSDINLGSVVEYQKISTIDDVVTPNFRQKMKRGEIVNNPCVMSVVETITTPSTYAVLNNGEPGYVDGASSGGSTFRRYHDTHGAYPDVADLDIEEGEDVAKLYALANIDSTPYSFAEDLAELRETARFLRGHAHRFEKLARRFAKEKQRLVRKYESLRTLNQAERARLLAEALSGLWATYRFVLTPLAQSMTDLLEAWNTKTDPLPLRLIARGKYEDEETVSDTHVVVKSNTFTSKYVCKQELDVRAGILYENINPTRGFRFKYGLRNKDIPVTLWNVVPLSFMVDRFFNISAAIKALTNLSDPSIKILAGWTTVRHNKLYKFKYTDRVRTTPDHTTTVLNGDWCTDRTFDYVRSTWEPSVSDVVPPVQLERLVSDVTSILDLLALGILALKK